MDTNLQNDNPSGSAGDNPNQEPSAGADGTVQPGGQDNGQASPTDANLGNVDPRRLPPELRKTYDSMLRDYRSKTEKLSESIKAETAKAVEAYKQKAEFYDQFVSHEELVKYYNDYANRLKQKSEPTAPGDPVQQKIQELEHRQAEIDREVRTSKALEVINAFADMKDEKGELVHPDFEKLSSISLGKHAQAGSYDLLRAATELAPGNTPREKLENGYKVAKAAYDAIFDEGRKAGMGRLQMKVKQGSLPPSRSSAPATASRRPKNALEAIQFARQGLEVANE